MSFSSEVKDDLLAAALPESEEKAMAYGMLLFGRSFSKSELSLLTEHNGTAEKYAEVIFSLCGEKPAVITTEGGKYKISVTDREKIRLVFSALELIGGSMARRINSGLLESTESKAAFIRGAFLVSGTVADPHKEYHLEFAAPTCNLSRDIVSVFTDIGEDIDIAPKITDRNGAYVVYMKKSESIEDTLALMGAGAKSLELMNVKVLKDVRNIVNRRINFESANLARTAAASAKQYEAIRKIERAGLLDTLSEELKEIAAIRLDGPELSNSEISEMLKKPLSVSGVNHRFAKLIKIAEGIE